MVRPFCRVLAGGAALVAALLATASCTSKTVVPPQSFTIVPPAARATAAPAAGHVVSLRRASVAAVYSGTALVYRIGEYRIESDPYARFGSAPAAMLTAAIAGYVEDAGFVKGVVSPGDAFPAVAEIEPYVSELYGDFRSPEDAAAVLAVAFRVLAPGAGTTPPRELLSRTYTQRIRVSERTAAAVVAGWNEALAAIMKAFLADLKPALP
jgi:ABC-type uncharacterized transport system auxiliary subunit